MSSITCLATSPYAPCIVTSDADHVFRVTNLSKGMVQNSCVIHEGIRALAPHPRGYLFALGNNTDLVLLDENLNTFLKIHLAHGPCGAVSFSSDGVYVAYAEGRRVGCVSVKRKEVVGLTTKSHPEAVRGLQWLWNNTRVISWSNGGSITVWNTATWEPLYTFRNTNIDTSGAVVSDGYNIFCTRTSTPLVHVLNIKRTGIFPVDTAVLDADVKEDLCSLSLSQSGDLLVAGTSKGKIVIATLPLVGSGCVVRQVHSGPIRCVEVSDAYACIATGGEDGTLQLFDVMPPFNACLKPGVPLDKRRTYLMKNTSLRTTLPSFYLLCSAAHSSWEGTEYLSEALMATATTPASDMYPALRTVLTFIPNMRTSTTALPSHVEFTDGDFLGLRLLSSAMRTWPTSILGGEELQNPDPDSNTSQILFNATDSAIDTSDLDAYRSSMGVMVRCRLRGDVNNTECFVIIPPNEKLPKIQHIVEKAMDRRVTLSFQPSLEPRHIELCAKTLAQFWALPDHARKITCTSLFPGQSISQVTMTSPPSRNKTSLYSTQMSRPLSRESIVSGTSSLLSAAKERDLLHRLHTQAPVVKQKALAQAEERVYGRPTTASTDRATREEEKKKILAVVERLTEESKSKHKKVVEKVQQRYSPENVAEIGRGLRVSEKDAEAIGERMYTGALQWKVNHQKQCEAKLFKSKTAFMKIDNKDLPAWLEKRATKIGEKIKLTPLEPVRQKVVSQEEIKTILGRLYGKM